MGVPAGSLEIQIFADIARLQSDMNQMKRAVGGATGDATTGFNRLNGAAGAAASSFGGIAAAAGVVGAALGAIGLASLAGDAIDVNREFQSLQASLKVATGSVGAAAAEYEKLKDFAQETPFAVDQAVEAFIKLKNLGLDPSTDALRSYGNTSASMGKDLMQMIEAVADASTGEFERLKEFGIKAAQEGDKVSFTFRGVTTTVKKSSDEIQAYLRGIGDVQFAGAMDAQMQTLNGQFANLEDAVQAAFVAFGEGGFNDALREALTALTGVAAGADGTAAQLGAMAGELIRAATAIMQELAPAFHFLVDNLDTIIDLAGVAAAGFVAFHGAMKAGAVISYASQLIALERALGAATATQAAAGVAAKGLQAGFGFAAVGARGLLAALGPLGVAIGVATAAWALLREQTDESAGANSRAQATLNQLKKEANETAPAAGVLGGALKVAQKEMLAATDKAQGLIAQLYGVKFAALQAAEALAQAKVAQAWDKVNRANASDLRSPFAVFMGVDFGKTRADAAEYKRATGELENANNELRLAQQATAKAHQDAARGAAEMMRATSGAAKAAGALASDVKKAGGASRAAKPDVDELAKSIEDMAISATKAANAFEGAFGAEVREWIAAQGKAWGDANTSLDKRLKALYEEYTLIGLSGPAREKAVLELEKEAFLAEHAALGIEGAALAWEKYRAARLKNIDKESGLQADLEAARKLTDELRDLTRAFDQLGGTLGKTLGDFAAVLEGLNSGDFGSVRGPLGAILQILSKDDGGKKALDDLKEILDGVFGDSGSFTKAIGGVLKNAGLGAAASSLILGKSGSQLGSAIGGAIGGVVAKAIGSTLGPVGAIVGGLLGGVVGDMIGGQKRGAAIITGTSVSGTYGDNAQRKEASTDLAGQVVAVVEKIAEQLGATINKAVGAVSIGIRDSNYRVDTEGRGYTKLDGNPEVINFGTDAAAAITAAAMDLIKDGVITGLRDGTMALLKSTRGTIDEQLAKAKAFEAVFAELATMKDPAGSAMRQLEAEFEQLKGIFAEAGASAGEYAQLEELYQLKRAELSKQEGAASEDSRERRELEIRIMELQGRGAVALAAARALELSEMDAALRPLQEQIYALQDARQARELDIQLLEAQGRASEALAMRRADELAGLTDVLAAKQLEIWAVQDAAKAANEAAEAAQELARAEEIAAQAAAALAEKRRSLEIRIMELTGDAVGALAARRADELAALDPSLRALQERIYALEDARAAEEAAAQAAQALAEAEARAAEERQRIADQRAGMEIALLRALGDESAALALERERELASIPETLRGLQQQIWAAQALAEAQAEAARVAEEAAAQAKAIADKRRDLEIQYMEAAGDAAGALAARRADELAALDPLLRALQQSIWSAQDAAAAQQALATAQAEAAAQAKAIADKRRDLEIQYMEATGDAAGALAARRADELAALDPTLRALQQTVWAAQDAAAALAGVADALALAKQAADLNIRLLEAQGQSEAALAARRQQELDAADPSLRATLQAIYAAEDLAKAQAAQAEAARQAREAQDAAAREAQQAAEEAARAAAELADRRASMEIQLMRALGNETGALARERERELAALDPSLRALQQQIWAAEDAARAQEELAKAQEEAAQRAEQLAKDRTALEIRILELQGRTAEATAMKRAQELAAMDASLRPLQQLIYAYEDAETAAAELAERQKAAADKVAEARGALSAAYERESGALRDTIDRFKSFSASLREFRGTLVIGGNTVFDQYRRAQAEFVDTAARARRGDEQALGAMAAVSKTFMDASLERASSLADYQRDVARVARATDAAIGAADREATIADQQLSQLEALVAGQIDTTDAVLSVEDAMLALLDAIEEQDALSPSPVISLPASTPGLSTPAPSAPQLDAIVSALSGLRDDGRAQNEAIAINTSTIARLLNRVIREDAITIRNESDQPLTGEVTIINTTASPVNTKEVA